MIEEKDYRQLQQGQPRLEPTEAEKEEQRKTIEYLESLPFRPFTCEW